ncbi:hypothetical protein Tco_1254742 [Tanacetum coccineum]
MYDYAEPYLEKVRTKQLKNFFTYALQSKGYPPRILMPQYIPVSPPVQEPIFTTTTTTLPPPLPTTALRWFTSWSIMICILRSTNKSIRLSKKRFTTLSKLYFERFRDLPEVQMKEILHDRMFKSGSYRSHPDHSTLYEALEASMQRDNNDELHAELTRSRKRRPDDQDPPPPPLKDSDQSKKKKHDSDVSASKQPPVKKSSAWKTSDIREAPSSSSKQKPASPPPVDDNLIPDDMHLS